MYIFFQDDHGKIIFIDSKHDLIAVGLTEDDKRNILNMSTHTAIYVAPYKNIGLERTYSFAVQCKEIFERTSERTLKHTNESQKTPPLVPITWQCWQPYCTSTTFHVQYDPSCGPKLICTQCRDDIDLDDHFLNKTLPTQFSCENEWQE